MAAKHFLPQNLSSLVDLEISVMKRYYNHTKDAKELSLIYFQIPETNTGYEWIIEKILRNTDAVVQEKNHFVAVLFATNKNGALKLLEGIQEFLSERPLDIVVNYPHDGSSSKVLLEKFQDEIKDNYGILLECLRTTDLDATTNDEFF
ncbi:pyridoxal-5'-phosphate-dependent protein [Campylobacter suis]|uniref:Uncharacterized protein n=1 Tax=Campylobacter suis TaxID=2790657 RepID=A0ABM8Q1G0_9BACT|nr:pyridoxal-5'-phosphate-dependent protein [Campylobacter suis]CAD7286613.1 hypothetical protein LMG8286_00446 [Campylobacter suis]